MSQNVELFNFSFKYLVVLSQFVLALSMLLIAKKTGLLTSSSETIKAPTLLQVACAFALYFFGQTLFTLGLFGWVAMGFAGANWFSFLSIFLLASLLTAYSLYCSATIWKRESAVKGLFLGVLSWLVIFPFVTLVAEVVQNLSRLIYPAPPLDQVAVRQLKSGGGLAIPIVVIFAPLIEEILFRGFLQNYLTKKTSSSSAIIITSLFFSFVHFSPSQGVANAELLSGLFVLSLFIGFLYQQRSLWASIGLHSTFNGVSAWMILLGISD